MHPREDPVQDILLAGPKPDSTPSPTQVEDEIKFPEYVDVSEEGKDFILKICKKDPDERMEMRDILRHPFITKYLKQRKVAPEVV